MNEWIPVSERLPEEGEVVLTTVKGIQGILENFVYADCRYINGIWESLVEANYDYWTEIVDVIAWMPYPEPYKENIYENHR